MQSLASFILDNRLQILSVTGSITLLYFIVILIKRRKLKEEYSLLWLAAGIFFSVISVFKPLLDHIADMVGIYYAPTALLLALSLAIIIILIHYSTVISKLSEQNKLLTQELALLKSELEQLRDISRPHSR